MDCTKEINKFIEYIKSKGILLKNNILNDYLIPVEVFTDGSVLNNGKKNSSGGCGIYISEKEQYSINYSKYTEYGPATNQKTELLAIYNALLIIENKYELNFIIYTDSMYSVNCVTKWYKSWVKNGWKSSSGSDVKNKDIIKNIINLLEKTRKNIEFKHINSHTKAPGDKSSFAYRVWNGNNMADILAKNGLG